MVNPRKGGMTIITDTKGVKLTVQEALINENVGRDLATLPWRVIDRLHMSGGDMGKISPV